MNRSEVIEKIARETGIQKKDVTVVVEGFLSVLTESLEKTDKVDLRGFGTFKVDERKARKARNPRTGAEVYVPAKKVPVFRPSRDLKERVNK
ncbi:MAG: integration host factor subunit beta [Candidatus Delongbacteria bacterium]|nr:integration host factor subunit beta [Candidatus Delongbacteria bacterium]